MTLEPNVAFLLSKVDFNSKVEDQARQVMADIETFKNQHSPKKLSDTLFNLAVHLSVEHPNLAHHIHYGVNGQQIDKTLYANDDIALRMNFKDTLPQYHACIIHDIKQAIGFLPNKEADFARKEMALRVTLKSLLESDAFDKFYWYNYIRIVFNKKNEHLNEHEKLMKKAKVKAKEFRANTNPNKSKAELYREGYEIGYFLTKQNLREGSMVSYMVHIDAEKENQYGSMELNSFMHNPLTHPEYGSHIRNVIKEQVGDVPWGDKNYPQIELALRYFFAAMTNKNKRCDKKLRNLANILCEEPAEKPKVVGTVH